MAIIKLSKKQVQELSLNQKPISTFSDKFTNEELQKALLKLKPVLTFSDEMREKLNKIDFTKLQALNNTLSSVAQQHLKALTNVEQKLPTILNSFEKIYREFNIDFVTLNKGLQVLLEGYYQFIEDIEEDKQDEYYILIKKYSNHLKERGLFVSENFKDFLEFWIPYNTKYFGLKHSNYYNDRFNLEGNDLKLYSEYEKLKIDDRKSNEEALEIVWNEHDKRNTTKINMLPPPATPLLENNISAPKKKDKQPTAEKNNSLTDANFKVNVFENIVKVRKNIKDSLHEFESKEFRGFTKRTLERAIKIKYNDNNLTFNSYVERYLSDKLSDKKRSINN